ncbi:RBBP9/YdeN family alpha/beta hydrolase [Methylotuvimicrobium alcaliphilum]|uniref:Predicted esterase of the alpha/beta hydrolase fold n=1 Tax=Methylotuvimicrobium alcaliphilum (strain DSM 19304 / NCIMB 14124 / VKM B-2133 / 20Z) TaxID=1091494 RepID=G4SW29_META2|nr:alpha/beta hydrolase [Methylotuvimicrobium alcaliphilum]CCE21950.1 Predicted esterase of the alpha/beta hydrolase fold [Methylotuvimicrobium alcaliphilum 20Z]
MKTKIITVPGFHGSDVKHWQTWLERQLPGSERVTGIDWESPQIFSWANAIEKHIDATPNRVILVAHSFGCLASALVASRLPEKVAGLILVAPASPQRFSMTGPIAVDSRPQNDISGFLPNRRLDTLGLLVASQNDPWMQFSQAEQFSRQWGLTLYDAGNAGHINSEAGYGEWPLIVEWVTSLQVLLESAMVNLSIQLPKKLMFSSSPYSA